eukprot:6480067-Amphidinium_carterae.2
MLDASSGGDAEELDIMQIPQPRALDIGVAPPYMEYRQYGNSISNDQSNMLCDYPWALHDKQQFQDAVNAERVCGRAIMHIAWRPGTRVSPDGANTILTMDFSTLDTIDEGDEVQPAPAAGT